MATVWNLTELHVADEGSFCENENSVTSNSFTSRIPIIEEPSLSLTQQRVSDSSIQSRQNESRPGFLTIREGTFSFVTHFPGHNTSPTGNLTATWAYTLLKDGLGGGTDGMDGTTIASATDADSFVATSAASWVAGGIARVGAVGDARGQGRPFVVSTVNTGTGAVEALTALPATPDAADVVYGALVAYPTENPTATKRFLYGKTGTGEQVYMLGCQLAGVEFSFPIGGLPTIRWTYQVATWERAADTVPSAITLDTANTAPVAGGALYYQTVGTTTWNTIAAAEASLSIDLGLAIKRTVGGGTYRSITGYQRTRCKPRLTIRLQEWDSAYETLFLADGSSTTHKHVMLQSCTTGGRSVGFYCPRVFPVGNHPLPENVNEIVGTSIEFEAREGTVTDSDLTRSVIRFFMS